MEEREDIKHIVRNKLIAVQRLLNKEWRIIDEALGWCKEIEDELNKLDKKENKGRNVVVDKPNERPFPV